MNERKRTIWPLWLAVLMLVCVGILVSFLNFWAACDLGYDRTPEGKRIIECWGNALLSTLVVGVILAVVTARSWWKSRMLRAPSQAQEQ